MERVVVLLPLVRLVRPPLSPNPLRMAQQQQQQQQQEEEEEQQEEALHPHQANLLRVSKGLAAAETAAAARALAAAAAARAARAVAGGGWTPQW
jgi:hypothetical protein